MLYCSKREGALKKLASEHMRDEKRNVLNFLHWQFHKPKCRPLENCPATFSDTFLRWIKGRRTLIENRLSAWQQHHAGTADDLDHHGGASTPKTSICRSCSAGSV
jgi:hypothetical protein